MLDHDDIPNRIAIRTDPDEGYAHRFETIEGARNELDVTSKTKAVLGACDHVRQDRRAKESTLAYLSDKLTPQELAEVTDRLSTTEMPLGVELSYHADDEDDEIELKTKVGNSG